MVNLRAIANKMTQTINPNLSVGWRRYTGHAVGASGKVTPTYAASVPLVAQVQALTKKEVEHLAALNLSTCERAAYVNGQIAAFDRLAQTGGDLLVFEGAEWKAMAILEGWTGGAVNWCKVALVKQIGTTP